MYLVFVQKDIVNGESLVRKQLYAKKLESGHQKILLFYHLLKYDIIIYKYLLIMANLFVFDKFTNL